VKGITKILTNPSKANKIWSGDNPDPSSSSGPWKVYNIGNNHPVELLDYIKAIESSLGLKAEKELLPLQPGDVPDTYADVDDLIRDFDFKPKVSVNEGVKNFVKWYVQYHG
jgi:UDP-glucuronate 4-epimerase